MDKFFKEIPRDRMVAGYRRTVRGIRADRIRCVLIARDADDCIVDDVRRLCDEKKIPYRFVCGKKELGERLCPDVPCAVCSEATDSAKF